jgi:hypothetical protein
LIWFPLPLFEVISKTTATMNNYLDLVLALGELTQCFDCNSFEGLISANFAGKKRRKKGEGSGTIKLHYCQKKGKSYEQYYYHYEIWENGVRQYKGSKYIPKTKLATVRSLENCKVPVTLILKELGFIV